MFCCELYNGTGREKCKFINKEVVMAEIIIAFIGGLCIAHEVIKMFIYPAMLVYLPVTIYGYWLQTRVEKGRLTLGNKVFHFIFAMVLIFLVIVTALVSWPLALVAIVITYVDVQLKILYSNLLLAIDKESFVSGIVHSFPMRLYMARRGEAEISSVVDKGISREIPFVAILGVYLVTIAFVIQFFT